MQEAILETTPVVPAYATHARRETFDGREHLIVPVSAIVEGVLNGVLVQFEELSKHPASWSGVPLPVGHPRDPYGKPLAANTVEQLAKRNAGRFFNPKANPEKRRLEGELWIDVERAKALGGDAAAILQKLEANQHVEVSTAYYYDRLDQSGHFKGAAYSAVAKNIRPESLALLPNELGACDRTMGCGAPMQNQSDQRSVLQKVFGMIGSALGFASNVTHDDIRMALRARLSDEKAGVFFHIGAVMDNGTFIYEMEEKQFRRTYVVGPNGAVTLGDEIVEVQQVTEFVPVAQNAQEGPEMTDQEKAAADAKAIADKAAADKLAADKAAAEKTAQNQGTPCGCGAAQNSAQIDPETIKLLADPNLKSALQMILGANQNQKAALVEAIAANAACKLTKEQLGAMDVATLQGLAASFGSVNPVYDFTGRGMPLAANSGKPVEPRIKEMPKVFLDHTNGAAK